MGGKRRKKGGQDSLPTMMIALGVGIFVTLFCSVRLILFFAAIALIYLGITYRSS